MTTETLTDSQAKSRQDQILLLAAEGMTDKEIASKLSLSPETVGTYWRRILSKYSAASRTEVVAKVVRLQAEASINEISEVNECLREVADHLLLELSGRQPGISADQSALAAAAIKGLSTYVLVVDGQGFIHFSNRPLGRSPLPSGEPFEWSVAAGDRDSLRGALGKVLSGEQESADVRFTYQAEGDAPVRFTGEARPVYVEAATMVLLELRSA